jgi:membrane carboxypeptidase/penicillin-binding protein
MHTPRCHSGIGGFCLRHFFRLSPLGLDHRVMRCTLCGLGLTSAQAALPSWVDFMKEVLVGRPSQEFLLPQGVVQVTQELTPDVITRPQACLPGKDLTSCNSRRSA